VVGAALAVSLSVGLFGDTAPDKTPPLCGVGDLGEIGVCTGVAPLFGVALGARRVMGERGDLVGDITWGERDGVRLVLWPRAPSATLSVAGSAPPSATTLLVDTEESASVDMAPPPAGVCAINIAAAWSGSKGYGRGRFSAEVGEG
jgi:hypothetical protein